MAVIPEKMRPKKPSARRARKRKDTRIRIKIHAQRGHDVTAPVNPQGEKFRRKGQVAGVLLSGGGMGHQAHLQDDGSALLHRTRLVVAHAGTRVPRQARQEAGSAKVQDTRSSVQGSQALAEEGAE